MKNYREVVIGPYSAYQIAVKHGFEGTEEDWLKSVERDRLAAEAAAEKAKEYINADATLTISGAPADAAVTGEKLNDRYTKAEVDREFGNRYTKTEVDNKIASIVSDKTLNVEGGFADSKTVGDIIYPKVTVSTDAGSNLKFSCGDIVINTTVGDTGAAIIKLPRAGRWDIKATLDDDWLEKSINVELGKDYDVPMGYLTIEGVCWNYGNSSTACTRLTSANDPNNLVNIDIATDPSPAVGGDSGSSPFDSYMPWRRMEEYNVVSGKIGPKFGEDGFTRSDADVVVFIPEFYYKIIDDAAGKKRYFYIANKEKSGFEKHPGSGRYVGRYNTDSNSTSCTGKAPMVSIIRATARNNAKNKGACWYEYDYASWCAIGLLYIVEYADWDSQSKIGRGNISSSAAISSGGTDSMIFHTGRASGTDGTTAVQYRHIENPWGNVFDWVDGVNFSNDTVYVCTDPTKYADDTSTGYTNAGTRATSGGYINALGASTTAPWAIYSSSTGGSDTTYIPDYSWYSSGWPVLFAGGCWNTGSNAGLFCFFGYYGSSYSDGGVGARLLFIPPDESSSS